MYSRRSLIVYLLFLFGTIYYLVFPILFSEIYFEKQFPLHELLYDYVSDIETFDYFIMLILYFLVFALGFKSKRKKIKKFRPSPLCGISCKVILLLLFFAQIFAYYKLQNNLFSGYSPDLDGFVRNSSKSFISGLNIAYLFFSIYFYYTKQKFLFNIYTFLLLMNSFILLGLGARMNVVPVFLGYIIIRFIDIKHIFLNKKNMFILLLIPFLSISIVSIGLLRQGDSINTDGLLYIFSAEPIFTWLGAGSFLSFNTIDMFNFPYRFIASFAILIPTAIWPNKFELIEQYSHIYEFDNPLGATSVIYVFLSNFGLLGTFIAIFVLGMFFKTLVNRSFQNTFNKTVFIVSLTIVPFLFFRSDSGIIIKSILFNSILVPYITIIFGNYLDKLLLIFSKKG